VHRSHEIFGEQLLKNVPFISTAIEALRQKKDGRLGKEFLLDILDVNKMEKTEEPVRVESKL